MGFSRHFIQKYNFMLTKITGEINDDDLSHHVGALNQETEGLTNLKELADCRGITKINLSTRGTTLNADREKNKPGSNLAILVPKENDMIFAMARAYQMFSENHRKSVEVFRDYSEAISWLTKDNSQEIDEINKFIKNS